MARSLIFAIAFSLFAGLLSPQNAPVARAQDASPAAGDTQAVAERFVQAMNDIFATGDATVLDEIVSPDYVDRTPSPTRTGGEQTPDLAGLRNSFLAVHDVFPAARVAIDDAIVEGDMAALLVTFEGMRGPDTIVDGALILRVEDGLVVESWNYERGGEERLQPMFEATPTS
jgi:hypothetical protein